MKRTIENRLSYRVVNAQNSKSVYGLMHDECGYWFTDFTSHKWNKINKKAFNDLLKIYNCDKSLKVIQDVSCIRF